MTHEQQRIWLIEHLLDEDNEYRNIRIPSDAQKVLLFLRALMNVRPPAPLSPAFLEVQDSYLQEENMRDPITDVHDLTPCPLDSRLFLWQGDITTLRADAIVNAANSGMTGCYQPLHSCIDNIIHSKSGIQLRLRCSDLMRAQGHEEPVGQAKITPAYNLPCRHVIHTVGPMVQGPLTPEHTRQLASCYTSCLDLAAEHHLESIAFCCISTGVFMFPNRQAAETAVSTVRSWLYASGSGMQVVFNVFKDQDLSIYRELLGL